MILCPSAQAGDGRTRVKCQQAWLRMTGWPPVVCFQVEQDLCFCRLLAYERIPQLQRSRVEACPSPTLSTGLIRRWLEDALPAGN